MYSLLAGLLKYLFSKTELQILILGLDHAGKTTLLEQMKGVFQKVEGIPLDRIPPTIGLNVGRMDINNCKVIFYDLGGQISLRRIWDKYYEEAQGILFVIDSADDPRFNEAKSALEELYSHTQLEGVPLLVFANKQDLPDAYSSEEIESNFDFIGADSGGEGERTPPRPFRLQPVSALTCEGVEDGISWLVDVVRTMQRTATPA